jgi:CheY-like chemotaxis protein
MIRAKKRVAASLRLIRELRRTESNDGSVPLLAPERCRLAVMASVLIVDDDVATRTMLADLLELSGYEVAVAGDGTEAITMLSARHFDAVVLDVMMPTLGGQWVIDYLGAQRPGEKCILLTTGGPAASLETLGQHESVRAALRKPLAVEELVRLVAECAAGAKTP